MKKIASLDGIRGLSVLAVFLYHTLAVPSAGHLGVEIFFVLSGFLISSQLFGEISKTGTIAMLKFYWRRCVRLLPAYAVMCVIFEAISYCFPSTAIYAEPMDLAEFLFTANYYWQTGGHPFPIISHVWTLATEWQFYLVWPFCLLVASKARVSKRMLLALMASAVMAIWIARLFHFGNLRIDGLLLGSCVALLKDEKRITDAIKRWAVPLFALCAGIAALMIFNEVPRLANQASTVVVAAAAAMVLVLSMSQSTLLEVIVGNSLLSYFGKISYGLYLYHFPIAAALYVSGATGIKMFIVCVFASIPIADFSFRFIESPLMRLGKKRPSPAVENEPLQSRII